MDQRSGSRDGGGVGAARARRAARARGGGAAGLRALADMPVVKVLRRGLAGHTAAGAVEERHKLRLCTSGSPGLTC